MGFNKKVLSQIKSDLNSAKAPARKKDIIIDPAGQWKYPGQNTRIPSNNITMQGVDYPVFAQPNIGQPQMMYPGQEYTFPGADYVDEYPQMKKGGQKKYSRSLEAKNRLFVDSPLVKKKKKKNKKIFNPFAKYYQDGGESRAEELLGPIPLNSGRKTLRDWTYGESIGMLQEQDGGEADYIELDLTPEEIEEYKKGGYVVEDISVPSLTRFTDGGNKRKKKKQTESEDDFQFTSNTQLYKLNDDASRAYAKSDSGKWYEYKSSQVGYDGDGKRIMKGAFYPIDPSYDVEKNLVPNVTAMSEDEKRTIKMGTVQMPTVKVKTKQKLFDKLAAPFRKIGRDYYEGKLTDEEIQQARDMYNTEYLDNLNLQGTNLRGVGDWLNYKFSSDEDWAKYVEEANKEPRERVYGSINDAYQEIYNNKKRQEDSDKYQQELVTLKKENPKEYEALMFKQEADRRRRDDPNLKPQSAQASDWLWTAGVLGGAGIGAGAMGDLAYGLGNIGEGALSAYSAPNFGLSTATSLAEGAAANAYTWENLIRAYTLADIGKEYVVDPALTGKAPETSDYNIVGDLVSLISPINTYTSGLSTSKSIGEGLSDFYQKGTPESLDDIRLAGKTTIGISKLPKIRQYGGEQDYEEAELTPAEIEAYRRQGYIVEEY
jgi:hypothetical protein